MRHLTRQGNQTSALMLTLWGKESVIDFSTNRRNREYSND